MESETNSGPQENDVPEQDHTPASQGSVPHHQGNYAKRRQHPRMSWRLASRISVVTFAILVIIVVMVTRQQGSSATSLPGTDLGKQPAPAFQLMDQAGQQISLTQFRGKPVVLTFLYTHCPDVCPLTAEHLHSTLLKMGSDAKNVGVLAVSTDPQRDDQAAAIKFTNDHNMQGYWHFLIGTEQQLSPVWSEYSVYAQQQQTTVNHSFAVYVIDKQGNNRLFVGQDFKPEDLASYLETLVHE